MTNLILFFCTVVVWFLILHFNSKTTSKNVWKRLLILIPLCAPFNVNDNIYTILGNAKSEKDIYSLTSFYQDANGDAFSVLSIFYQNAGSGASSFVGILNYSSGVKSSRIGFSFLPYQVSKDYAGCFLGLVLSQQSDKQVETGIGISLHQKAKYVANVGIGISLYQEAKYNTETCFGLSFFQKAKKCTTPVSLALYQIEDGKSKCFVAFTSH